MDNGLHQVNIDKNRAAPPQGALLSKLCQTTRSDGAPCGAPSGKRGLCFWHDPERREEMLAASRNGGGRKALPLPVGRPLKGEEAQGLLASVLAAPLEGALDPNTARAAAYILQVERKIAEGVELERRIAGLEALLSQGNGKAAWQR
jgi:hypothetical protein